QNAACFACLHQVYEQLVEHLGMPTQRVGERRPLLYVGLDVLEHSREPWVRLLTCQDVQTLHEWQTGVDHRCEQARERNEISNSNPGTKLRQLELPRLLLDARDDQVL